MIQQTDNVLKVLHFSDVHMGVETYGRIDPDTGLNVRMMDIQKCLSFMIDTALEEDVSLALFVGDAYSTCNPNPTHQKAFASQLRRLSEADIPVVMVVGNHDNPVSFGRASSIDIFGTLNLSGVRVVSKPDILSVATRYGPAQIACLPWPTKSTLLTHNEYKDLSETEVLHRIEEICIDIIKNFATQVDPHLPSFLLAHIAAADAMLAGSERTARIGNDPVLLTSVLADSAFDYVALGHVHRFQDLNPSGDPHVVYSGSIERVDFGEEKDERGFCIITCDPSGKTSFRFVPTPARCFRTIEVIVDPSEDPTNRIIEDINRYDLTDAIVRVNYTIQDDKEHFVDVKQIRSSMDRAYAVASITQKKARPERLRRTSVTEDLDVMPALDRYFENNPFLTPFKDDMKTYALKLVAEMTEEDSVSADIHSVGPDA